MVSTFSKSSAISILNCLFLWVLLILVIPNVCPYISAQFCRIPSIKQTERQNREIEIHSIEAARELMKKSVKEFQLKYGALFSEFESMEFGGIGTWLFLGRDAGSKYEEAARQRAEADPKFKTMMDTFREEFVKARNELIRIRKANPVEDDLHRKAALQTKLAKNLACISPFANYVYVARDLTGTGMRSLEHYEEVKGEYQRQLRRYEDEKIQDAREKDPAFEEESFLDVSDRPRFVFKEEPLKDKLGEVLPYWGILGLFNVVFFVAAFAGFMRYDVR
jgi:ABC-type transport system involved in multi-copper enzyme maturation permease subunit